MSTVTTSPGLNLIKGQKDAAAYCRMCLRAFNKHVRARRVRTIRPPGARAWKGTVTYFSPADLDVFMSKNATIPRP